MTSPSRTRVAALLLVATTAVWGSTFFLIRDLVQTVPAIDFLAVRFSIAALVMLLVFGRHVRGLTRRELGYGVALGGLYGGAQIMQTIGLASTPASISGFITGMYVVLTPVGAALLFRDRIGRVTWCAVALATAGLALLSLRGGLEIGPGEGLTLAAAGVYALHIIGLGRWSRASTALGLTVVQGLVIALICLLGATPGGITLPADSGQWASTLYMALIAGAGALWAQTWAQSHLTATKAALVMTLEPVFAASFAVLFGGESLTVRMLLGGGCVLAAMYLVELRGERDPDSPPIEALHHEV